MKLVGIVSLALLETCVLAFSDTAPFYCSKPLGSLAYYENSADLALRLTSLTDDWCIHNKKTVIFRVKNLQHHHDPVTSGSSASYVEHVHYNSAADLDLPLGNGCTADKVAYQLALTSLDKTVTIVDVEDDKTHTVSDFTEAIGDPLIIVVVQGKPSFTTGSHLQAVKNYVDQKVYDNLHIELGVQRKRSDSEDSDKIAAEVEADFAKAESLLALSPHADVTALAVTETSKPSTTSVLGSLFTEYRFFSPGIWLGLIVSAMLITVLLTALLWIGSLEISYRSFDKQVDYEKKNE